MERLEANYNRPNAQYCPKLVAHLPTLKSYIARTALSMPQATQLGRACGWDMRTVFGWQCTIVALWNNGYFDSWAQEMAGFSSGFWGSL